MILGLLIGFSLGVCFSIILFVMTHRAHYYFRFHNEGRLLRSNEIKARLGSNIRFYMVRDLFIFNAIAYPKPAEDEDGDGIFPWEVFASGFMLKQIHVNKTKLLKEFPEAEVIEVSLPAFG